MFGKKKEVLRIDGSSRRIAEGISMVKQTETITERLRSPADAAKVETMVWLLGKIANEHLDSVFVTLLQECKDLGYNLVDEPGALLERLKRQF